MEEENTTADVHSEIGKTIIVVIPGRTGNPGSVAIYTSLFAHVFKSAISQVVVQRHRSLSSVVRKKKINLAIVVVVYKARTRTQESRHLRWRCLCTGAVSNP